MNHTRDPRTALRKGAPKHLANMTAASVLRIFAVVVTIAGFFWWTSAFLVLFSGNPVAYIGALIISIAPAGLGAFVIPWTPAAQLLFRILGRTIGGSVSLGSFIFLLYVQFELLLAFFYAIGVTDSEIGVTLTFLFIIGLTIVPALIWSPVLASQAQELIHQQELVDSYEIQVKSRIQQMKVTLLRAQLLTLKGFANLLPAEREELAKISAALVLSIETTLKDLSVELQRATDITLPYEYAFNADAPAYVLASQLADGLAEIPQGGQDALDRLNNSDLALSDEPARESAATVTPPVSNEPRPTRPHHRRRV